MRGLRDLIRDPRVAAVLAASAVVFVGYRVHQGMPGSGSDPSPSGSVAAPGPADREVPPGGGGRAPALRDTIPEAAKNMGSAARGDSGNGAAPVEGLMRLAGGAASRGKDAAGPRGEAPWSWDRNPFLPAERRELSSGILPGFHGTSSRGPNGGRLDLQAAFRGTVVSGDQGVAIFGDRIVSEGGTVGEWTVEKVEPYRVVMRHGTESRTLEMFRPSPPGR